MNCDTPIAALLDVNADMTVQDGRLVIKVAAPLPDELLDVLRPMRDEILEAWQERAAVREFDGGYSRPEAERLAWRDLRDFGVSCCHPVADDVA